jgi:homoserine kinase
MTVATDDDSKLPVAAAAASGGAAADDGAAAAVIEVPGSISNLGPGFDALSVAVQIYLRVRVVDVRPDSPDTIETVFVGASPGGENRIETAFRLARQRIGRAAPGVRIEVQSDIPTRAGLGSSGAATVAGLRLYGQLTGALDAPDLLALATEVEGHPDNAAAALLGGFAVSCQQDDGRIVARTWPWPDDLQCVVATPDLPLETAHARGVLAPTLSRCDAIFNLQRALLFVHAVTQRRYDDLREALRDRWHQPARTPMVPGLADALALDHPAVLGACLSGAGPSIVALTAGRAPEAAAQLSSIYQRLGVPATVRVLAACAPAAS